MKEKFGVTGQSIAEGHGLALSKRTVSILKIIEAQPGSVPSPRTPPRASVPNVLIYKVMDKMFAIISIRGTEGVILKCDPDQALFLREQYEGVGHRSHRDPRFWISVGLDADIPINKIKSLVKDSYELVCSKLTKGQKAELLNL